MYLESTILKFGPSPLKNNGKGETGAKHQRMIKTLWSQFCGDVMLASLLEKFTRSFFLSWHTDCKQTLSGAFVCSTLLSRIIKQYVFVLR